MRVLFKLSKPYSFKLIPGFLVLTAIFNHTNLLACDFRLTNLNDIHITYDHDYKMKSDQGKIVKEQFQVKSDKSNCEYFISFEDQNQRRLYGDSGSFLNIQLFDSVQLSNELKNFSQATTNSVISGHLSKNQLSSTHNYYLLTAANKQIPAGIYIGQIRIDLYEGNLRNYELKDSQTVTYTVEIENMLDISFRSIGTQETALLDFGVLHANKQRSFDIEISSNSAYDLTISSEFGGRLKHTRYSDTYIPYTLIINNSAIDLKNTNGALLHHNSKTDGTDYHHFTVEIGDFDFALNGEYNDNIILTVSAP